MPKLIVQDGDKKRAFRLSKGRLTLGSAASNKLVLESSGVAAEHAVLVLRDDLTTIDALAPVEIDGQKVSGNGIAVAIGSTVKVGSAVLVLQADASDTTSAVPASAAAVPAAKAGARAQATQAAPQKSERAGAARSSSSRTGRGETAERPGRRGTQKAGKPAWVMPLIIGLALLIMGVAISLMTGGNDAGILNQGLNDLKNGNLISARQMLESVEPGKLRPEAIDAYNELKEKLETAENEAKVGPKRAAAVEWADTFLLRYRQSYLSEEKLAKDPAELQAAKKRLWLERFAEFERRFPDYDSAEWRKSTNWATECDDIKATKLSYSAVADASRAPNQADLDWAIFYYTDPKAKSGRRPDLARAVLDAYAAGGGSSMVVQENRTLIDQRATAYADAQMVLARKYFDQGVAARGEMNTEYGKSANLLIEVAMVTGIGDKANEALSMLGKFPNLQKVMLSYVSYEERDEVVAEKVAFLERAGPGFVAAIKSAREEIAARAAERAVKEDE